MNTGCRYFVTKIKCACRTKTQCLPVRTSAACLPCFTVRKGYRRRGITYHLAAATVGYARDRGAAALEAYPMIVPPGKEITWGELHVGSVQVFEEAGFAEVARPSPRRVVMRVAFTGGG